MTHAIAQFIGRGADIEIGGRVAPRTTLDRDDFKTGAGEFIGKDRSGPAQTDNDDILARQTASHQRSPVQAGRPCSPTGGSV